MESLEFLRQIETQGLYRALQEDIAEALDISTRDLNISSSKDLGGQQNRDQPNDSEPSLHIDQPPV